MTAIQPMTTHLTPKQVAEIRDELRRASVHYSNTPRADVIASAIERLDMGAYGTCVGCENPIPFDRLAVMPETDRCVGCSAMH